MARVQVLKQAITLCMKAGITPFVWGKHGLGKSSIVKQIAAEGNMGFIDMRCSQMEASDLRGLPDRQDGRTTYLPPAEMPVGDMRQEQILEALLQPFLAGGELPLAFKAKAGNLEERHNELLGFIETDIQARRVYDQTLKRLQPRFEHGIIFLDELNRAQDDVQQASFQFVLDREIGQYRLPPGWSVVTAGNYNEGYQVSGFTDPAFLDRFCHLTFSAGDTTMEDWIFYMSQAYQEDAVAVIEFASQNIKHLDGDVDAELGFTIQPSRRSWDAVVRVQMAATKHHFNGDAVTEVLAGLVGRELALSFSRYNCPVKPRELLTKGVNAHKKLLDSLNRGQLIGLLWGIVATAKDKIEDDATAEACIDFAEWIVTHNNDKDLAVAFCRAMVIGNAGDDQERAAAAMISNPKLARMIGKFSQKSGGKKDFIYRLNQRPKLQAVIGSVAWGGAGDE